MPVTWHDVVNDFYEVDYTYLMSCLGSGVDVASLRSPEGWFCFDRAGTGTILDHMLSYIGSADFAESSWSLHLEVAEQLVRVGVPTCKRISWQSLGGMETGSPEFVLALLTASLAEMHAELQSLRGPSGETILDKLICDIPKFLQHSCVLYGTENAMKWEPFMQFVYLAVAKLGQLRISANVALAALREEHLLVEDVATYDVSYEESIIRQRGRINHFDMDGNCPGNQEHDDRLLGPGSKRPTGQGY